MNKRQLLELKDKIDATKQEVSTLKGKLEYLEQQLQSEWDCSSIKEAEKKIQEMESESHNLDDQIKDGLKELEEKYGY